jgi:hypothetical protein
VIVNGEKWFVFQPKDIYALKIIIERLYWRHDDRNNTRELIKNNFFIRKNG